MQWYALEPVIGKNPAVGATLLPAAKIPIVQEYIARRNKIGPPLKVGVLRSNLRGFAHCDVFVEGLEKAGVPE